MQGSGGEVNLNGGMLVATDGVTTIGGPIQVLASFII